MGQTFALQALANSGFDQQVDCALLEQSGTHALLDVFSAARFDDHAFDALQVQQVGEN
jgi:hypothetical protein